MSWTLLLACIWVVLVSIVALTPFPQHKPYALALFVCAASIYRYPQMYVARALRRKMYGEA